MVRVVAPSLLTEFKIKSLITPEVIGSRPDVGSSNKRISGLSAIALAIATLFCIPPDNSAGKSSST